MVESTNQFKKAPRRKTVKGKRVPISPETRAAYEQEIKARTEREEQYLRHLPAKEPR